MTGASVAMPLLAATSATAADAGTWDKVAQCESGGMWSANQGNGFFGGLQITQELWEQYGGISYAPRPDLASRSQQIAIAESILKSQGAGPWTSCGERAGLAHSERAPEVDPGTKATPPPAAETGRTPEHTTKPAPEHGSPAPDASRAPDATPAPSGTPSGSPSTSPSGTATPAPGSSGAPSGATPDASHTPDAGGTPSAPASGTPDAGPGKHRKEPGADLPSAPADGSAGPAGTPGAGGASAGDAGAAEGSGRHRATPTGPDDGAQRPSRGGDSRPGIPAANDYTVQPGDNLSVIAQEHAVSGGWQTLYQKNEKVVGTDPDLILPGQRLDIRQ
ncbi:transglycosylase family protein [Streptomyces luteosporeus]|uniref:transglycosylase family protein n=1 Tax=Streptomyces luteosporeus TaxID=173856 RepID=UPI0031CF673C